MTKHAWGTTAMTFGFNSAIPNVGICLVNLPVHHENMTQQPYGPYERNAVDHQRLVIVTRIDWEAAAQALLQDINLSHRLSMCHPSSEKLQEE